MQRPRRGRIKTKLGQSCRALVFCCENNTAGRWESDTNNVSPQLNKRLCISRVVNQPLAPIGRHLSIRKFKPFFFFKRDDEMRKKEEQAGAMLQVCHLHHTFIFILLLLFLLLLFAACLRLQFPSPVFTLTITHTTHFAITITHTMQPPTHTHYNHTHTHTHHNHRLPFAEA
jgi:hypothetical protein